MLYIYYAYLRCFVLYYITCAIFIFILRFFLNFNQLSYNKPLTKIIFTRTIYRFALLFFKIFLEQFDRKRQNETKKHTHNINII